jgi:tetratricopeptide (TPR) repeat protein
MSTLLYNFLQSAPAGMARVLQRLATPESLTDELATLLYEQDPIAGISAQDLLAAIHYVDFVQPRNSEWHLNADVRHELQRVTDVDTLSAAHQFLLTLSDSESGKWTVGALPRYLFTHAGIAYHAAGSGDKARAFKHYGMAGFGPLSGRQWLALKLFEEQSSEGVLPSGTIEELFLRGMVAYREGRHRDARPLFEKIVESDQSRLEVSISAHLLGNMEARSHPRRAESLYKQALATAIDLGDEFGEAQILHSIGVMLSRDSNRVQDAQDALWRSAEIGRALGEFGHVAKVQHTLGNLIGREPARSEDAESLLRESIGFEESRGTKQGLAEVLHTLANLIARDKRRSHEAEEIYKKALKIEREIGHSIGVAQILHSLGNLIRRQEIEGRLQEAEQLLLESLQIGEHRRDLRHQAQVLRSLGLTVSGRNISEARKYLLKSLELNLILRDQKAAQLVRRSLSELS